MNEERSVMIWDRKERKKEKKKKKKKKVSIRGFKVGEISTT